MLVHDMQMWLQASSQICQWEMRDESLISGFRVFRGLACLSFAIRLGFVSPATTVNRAVVKTHSEQGTLNILSVNVIASCREWPYDAVRREPRTRMKGHKVDREAAIKRARTVELMEKMPQLLAEMKKRRWERKLKS